MSAGRRMFRYAIPVDDKPHDVVLTSDPVAVGVAVAGSRGYAVEFWAEYDQDAAGITRLYQVFGTGHPLPDGAMWAPAYRHRSRLAPVRGDPVTPGTAHLCRKQRVWAWLIGWHRIRVCLEPRDAWVGAYLAPDAVYVCLVPFLVIRWTRRTLP